MEPRENKRLITSCSIDLIADLTPGSGKVLDLTPNGCRIRSNVAYNFPKELSLSLHAPIDQSPITVMCATVRWIKDDEIGLEFVQVLSEERDRLLGYIYDLENARRAFHPFAPELRQEVQSLEVDRSSLPIPLKSSWWKVSFSR